MIANFQLSKKQWEVWKLLDRPDVAEVFAGGAAGGGKSFLLCLRQIYRRTTYADTRGFIGRRDYTSLRDSTMKTYFGLLNSMGMEAGVHYRYNAQEHILYFKNGSEQHFRHMSYQPSDPDYTTRFGSTEYTDAAIDEGTEVEQRAAQVLLSRLRYNHAKHGISKELLITGNPGDHWAKYYFVQDQFGKKVDLPPHRKTVLFNLFDNPDKAFRSDYAKTLELLDDYDKARLLYGDWDAVPNITRPFAYAYDEKKHVRAVERMQGAQVIVVVDFNLDPFCANLFQMYRRDGQIRCEQFQEITIPGGSVPEMADRIVDAVGADLYTMQLTGDASGAKRSIERRDKLSLFGQLRDAMKIHDRQIIVRSNPLHTTSRNDVNYFLQHFPGFVISETCTNTRRDMRTVQVDATGSIIKRNRNDVSQQADHIDNIRYLVNAFFADAIKKHRKFGKW